MVHHFLYILRHTCCAVGANSKISNNSSYLSNMEDSMLKLHFLQVIYNKICYKFPFNEKYKQICKHWIAKKFLEEGDLPWPIFAPPWPKNNNTCKGPWVLHAYQVLSKSIKRFWRRSWKCESLRTTDGRYDNSSLEPSLRWAKNGPTFSPQVGP